MKKVLLTTFVIISLLSGCTTNKIYSKPTRRQINKGMSYADWRYIMPSIKK